MRTAGRGGRYHRPARAVKRQTAGAALARGGAGQASPGAFRSRHHRIGDGEVIEAGFVGPVAGGVIRVTPGGIGGRPEAEGYGGEPQMVQDLPDNRGALDDGDDLHRAPAARTDQRIHLVDLADQARPGPPSLQRCILVPLGG